MNEQEQAQELVNKLKVRAFDLQEANVEMNEVLSLAAQKLEATDLPGLVEKLRALPDPEPVKEVEGELV